MSHLTTDTLQRFALLRELDPGLLAWLAGRLQRLSCPAGETVIRRGDACRGLFFILSGELRLTLTTGGWLSHRPDTLRAGGLFGEAAILTDDTHKVEIVAATPAQLLLLPPDACRELLARAPQLYRPLCRILAAKLGRSESAQQQLEQVNQELLATLSSVNNHPEFEQVPGVSRWARQLNEQIRHLAPGPEHLLIRGEPGTGKELVARLLHLHRGRDGSLFHLDCSDPPLADSSEGQEAPDAALEAALFGRGERHGYLELATGGDLILENLHQLPLALQRRLADELQGGRHLPRLLATAPEHLERLAEQGAVHRKLLELFAEELLCRPLRERRKDIPVIAEALLPLLGRRHQRQVSSLTTDAVHRLLDYSWPLNVDELRQVLDHAVASASDDTIGPELLRLGRHEAGDQERVNLLALPWLRRQVDSARWPTFLRLALLAGFLLMLPATLYGPFIGNPLNTLFWLSWWPLLVLLTWFGARGWCSLCPLGTLSAWFDGRWRGLPFPEPLRVAVPWLGLAGILAILYLEQAAAMHRQALATGILLSVLLGSCLAVNLLFGQRLWCRLLCPLGRLVGKCARIALVELRSNRRVCTSQCSANDCVRERECPMRLHPMAANSTDDCILCFQCARHCPHHSVRLDLRLPWQGEPVQRRQNTLTAVFATTLAGAVLAGALLAHGWLPPSPWRFAAVCGGVSLLAWLACRPGRDQLRRFRLVGGCWLPLTSSTLFAGALHDSLRLGEALPAQLLAWSGLDAWLRPESLTPELGTLVVLAPLALVTGGGMSLWMLAGLRRGGELSSGVFQLQRLLLVGMLLGLLVVL